MSGPTQPTEQYFDKGLWGYDGSRWRKLALLWGYTDRYAEKELAVNVAAGSHALAFTVVPSGEVWTVTQCSGYASTSNPSLVTFRLMADGVAYDLLITGYTTAWHTVRLVGEIVLKAGDYLVVYFEGCVLNDSLYAFATGYKMAVG